MGTKIFDLHGDVSLKTGDVQKGLDQVKSKAEAVGKKLKQVGDSLTRFGSMMSTRVTVPLIALGTFLVKLGSDSEEVRAKFNTAFRDVRDQADRTAASLAENYGLSQTAAERLLSSTGDLLKGFGATGDHALNLSNRVQELAVDLVSYSNIQGGASTASEILTKAMLGERDALTSLGIKISEAEVQQRLLETGQADLTGRALLLARAEATLALAYEQSGDALGDFARTSDSFAGQIRMMKADAEDAAVSFKEHLLPAATALVGKVRELIQWFGGLDDSTKSMILAIGGVAASLGPLAVAIGLVTKAMMALAANPIVAVLAVLGVALMAVASKFVQTRIEGARMNAEIRATRKAAIDAATAIRELSAEEELRILAMQRARIEEELSSGALSFQAALYERTGEASATLARKLVDLQRIETEIAILRNGEGGQAAQAEFDFLVAMRGQLDQTVVAENLLRIAIQQRINVLDELLQSEGTIADENERIIESARTLAEKLALLQAKYEALGGSDGPINLTREQMSLYREVIETLIESGIDPQNKALQDLIITYRELAESVAIITEETSSALTIEEALAQKRSAIRQEEKAAQEERDRLNIERIAGMDRLAEEEDHHSIQSTAGFVAWVNARRKASDEAIEEQSDAQRRFSELQLSEVQRRIRAIETERDAFIDGGVDAVEAQQWAQGEITAIILAEHQKRIDAERGYISRVVSDFRSFVSSIGDLISTVFDRQIEAIDAALAAQLAANDEEYNAQLAANESRYEILTEAEIAYQQFLNQQAQLHYESLTEEARREYDLKADADAAALEREQQRADEEERIRSELAAEKERIERELAIKKAEIERQQAVTERVYALASVAFNTAVAIAKAWRDFGWPLALVPAGLAAAMGVAEATTILAQRLPEIPTFAAGGIVPGRQYTGDQVVSRLNSGEVVLTHHMQENLVNLLASHQPQAQASQATTYHEMTESHSNPTFNFSSQFDLSNDATKRRAVRELYPYILEEQRRRGA